MSFVGKKYRRVGCENIDTLVQQTNASPGMAHILNGPPPIFWYLKEDENVYTFRMIVDSPENIIKYTFKLGEEIVFDRLDGAKIGITYTMERDNVLNQVIRMPEGKMGYFRREFGENGAIMTLRMDGAEVEGKIFYEQVIE